MSAVEFIDVVKIYGKGEGKQVAVDYVSFTIDKGECVVMLRYINSKGAKPCIRQQ